MSKNGRRNRYERWLMERGEDILMMDVPVYPFRAFYHERKVGKPNTAEYIYAHWKDSHRFKLNSHAWDRMIFHLVEGNVGGSHKHQWSKS